MNLSHAKQILYHAYDIAIKQNIIIDSDICKFIDDIINNTHLTFKYILFTAILAKATDSSINTLCLQAGSTLKGAYDARSLCHKVIVPFECNELNKAMGGSNEPFLNKPARFPEISLKNPVRRGNDKLLLEKLYTNLPKINNSELAFSSLVYLLRKLIEIGKEKKNMIPIDCSDISNSKLLLIKFFDQFLTKSCEGECLTLVIAMLYKCLYNKESYKIDVHPVNECGASSKEISDLDIYNNGNLVISNEIKDKKYNANDIKHATSKVMASGGNNLIFIEGLNGYFDDSEYDNYYELIEEYKYKYNFILSVISIKDFIPVTVINAEIKELEIILDYAMNVICEQKYKQTTLEHYKNTIKLFFS